MAVVTISRQLGSIGDLVARRAAELLGYDLVDKNLITEIAREARVPESEIENYDEQSESPVRRFLRGLIVPSQSVPVPPAAQWGLGVPYEVSAALVPDDGAASEDGYVLNKVEYLKFLQATVRRLWKRGNVIIVGRGGQAILRGDSDTVHVRTVAPLETRVRVVVERGLASSREAKDLIQKNDRRRSAYLWDSYGIDWNDRTLYHITLNTGRTPREVSANIIEETVRSLFPDCR